MTMISFPFRSLREWIAFLAQKDLLVNNRKEVDLRGELASISRRICELNERAVIHENIKGYPGWKIFSDGLTTRERQALALGVEEKGIVPRLADTLSKVRSQKP